MSLQTIAIAAAVLASAAMPAANAHQPVPPPRGLQHWWPGDRNTDDITGSLQCRRENGAIFGDGMVKQAFKLLGNGEWIDVPGSEEKLNVGSKSFTVDFWVKFRDFAGEQVMIEKWDQSSFSGWTLTKLESNQVRFAGGPPEIDLDVTVPGFSTGRWYFVALRRSGDTVTIFWDGLPLGTTVLAPDQILNADTTLKFGRRGDDRGFFLRGVIDEVEVFSRALTRSEIQGIYRAREAGKIK